MATELAYAKANRNLNKTEPTNIKMPWNEGAVLKETMEACAILFKSHRVLANLIESDLIYQHEAEIFLKYHALADYRRVRNVDQLAEEYVLPAGKIRNIINVVKILILKFHEIDILLAKKEILFLGKVNASEAYDRLDRRRPIFLNQEQLKVYRGLKELHGVARDFIVPYEDSNSKVIDSLLDLGMLKKVSLHKNGRQVWLTAKAHKKG